MSSVVTKDAKELFATVRVALGELEQRLELLDTADFRDLLGENKALRRALQEIAEADAKTPVLTLNRIAERALESNQDTKGEA